MSQIPRFSQRLHAIYYRQKFNEDVEDILPEVRQVEEAITAVRSSQRLRTVLKSVLVIGNYINGNSYRGRAYGFSIDSLLALKDTKCADNSEMKERAPTLLHYLARRLEETDEESLDLKEELAPLEGASRGLYFTFQIFLLYMDDLTCS
jgi:diaphanous 1